jgi:hypothetical protein
MKYTEIYEIETGEKATYRRAGSDWHTLRYIEWLEKRANYAPECRECEYANDCPGVKEAADHCPARH